jgi:MEMO1 family protein
VVVDDVPHANEHALEVELPFLQTVLGSIRVVPLLVGSAAPREVAEVLSRLWDDDTLIVVSSDLSHYLRYENARRRDEAIASYSASPRLAI